MKIWKFAAIAMLAMAPAAFGAVALEMGVGPTGAVKEAPLVPGTPVSIGVWLDPGTDLVTGVSFAISTDQPGAIRLTKRTLNSATLTGLNTDDSVLLLAANSLLSPKNARDAGIGAPDGMTPTTAGRQLLMTLEFSIEAGKQLTYPAQLSLVGAGIATSPAWADPDFGSWDLPVTTFTLTPEPASMLLLAAGAAFFARRRRA